MSSINVEEELKSVELKLEAERAELQKAWKAYREENQKFKAAEQALNNDIRDQSKEPAEIDAAREELDVSEADIAILRSAWHSKSATVIASEQLLQGLKRAGLRDVAALPVASVASDPHATLPRGTARLTPHMHSPLKVSTVARPGAALCVFETSAFPAAAQFFANLSDAQKADIRSGRDKKQLWALVQAAHDEWRPMHYPAQAIVVSDNRVEVAAVMFDHIVRAPDAARCRLLTGVRGIGKTTLLQMVAIAASIAFGDSLLAIFYDFQLKGRDDDRHPLVTAICEAIKVRWPQSAHTVDARMHSAELAVHGSLIARAIALCHKLGREQQPKVEVTVALIADELQTLFEDGTPSTSTLHDLMAIAKMPRVASFLTGSAHQLADGLVAQNFHLDERMLPLRLLPLATREEMEGTQPLWHADWSDESEFALLPAGSELRNRAMQDRIFLYTGGVLRYMFKLNRAISVEHALSLKTPNTTSPYDLLAWAVLALLYAHNRNVCKKRGEAAADAATANGESATSVDSARRAAAKFEPFQQASLSMEEVCTGLQDERVREEDIRALADRGWLLLSENDSRVSFLRPRYFEHMTSRRGEFSLLELAAIRFPEGRTLGEQWEVFRAEHLVENYPLRWFDNTRPGYLHSFCHTATHTEQFFRSNENVIFKLVPDTLGVGLYARTRTCPPRGRWSRLLTHTVLSMLYVMCDMTCRSTLVAHRVARPRRREETGQHSRGRQASRGRRS